MSKCAMGLAASLSRSKRIGTEVAKLAEVTLLTATRLELHTELLLLALNQGFCHPGRSSLSPAFGVLAKGFGFPFSFTLALGGCGGGS